MACVMRIAALLGLLVGFDGVMADSKSWTFKGNNNKVVEAQRQGRVAGTPGDVKLTFYGHMAFKITSPQGTRLLIDPWRNDPSGHWGVWFPVEFPEIDVDIVLSTHAHFDHDAVYRPRGVMVLERLAGEFALGDVKITGLADKHMCAAKGWYKWTEAAPEFGQQFCPPDNPLHMDNFIQVIETGGLKIVHWGDNRPLPAPHVEAQLQDIDVLILPIDDSAHILTAEDVDAAIHRYKPKIVIPAHYRVTGASSVLSTLGTADTWVGRQKEVSRLDRAELVLNATALHETKGQVYYFGMNYAKE